MLFSEIYSAYYNTVAAIISSAQKEELDSDSLYSIVKESAFPESYLTIGSALENGKWPLIKKDFRTRIKNVPTMPLSLLQRQWLKAILADKRFRLFVSPDDIKRLENDLQGIEPLFRENDFYLYDKYSDGDPYDDEKYSEHFRTVLTAIHSKKFVRVDYTDRTGRSKRFVFLPQKIEYSQKDDKFRCISKVRNRHAVLNIARILKCEITDDSVSDSICESDLPDNNRTSVTLEIYDERKAMERVMLAFAHFEKTAVQLDKDTYRLTINYDSFDERELVIRVLSFGPMIKVVEPRHFIDLVKERILKQTALLEH